MVWGAASEEDAPFETVCDTLVALATGAATDCAFICDAAAFAWDASICFTLAVCCSSSFWRLAASSFIFVNSSDFSFTVASAVALAFWIFVFSSLSRLSFSFTVESIFSLRFATNDSICFNSAFAFSLVESRSFLRASMLFSSSALALIASSLSLVSFAIAVSALRRVWPRLFFKSMTWTVNSSSNLSLSFIASSFTFISLAKSAFNVETDESLFLSSSSFDRRVSSVLERLELISLSSWSILDLRDDSALSLALMASFFCWVSTLISFLNFAMTVFNSAISFSLAWAATVVIRLDAVASAWSWVIFFCNAASRSALFLSASSFNFNSVATSALNFSMIASIFFNSSFFATIDAPAFALTSPISIWSWLTWDFNAVSKLCLLLEVSSFSWDTFTTLSLRVAIMACICFISSLLACACFSASARTSSISFCHSVAFFCNRDSNPFFPSDTSPLSLASLVNSDLRFSTMLCNERASSDLLETEFCNWSIFACISASNFSFVLSDSLRFLISASALAKELSISCFNWSIWDCSWLFFSDSAFNACFACSFTEANSFLSLSTFDSDCASWLVMLCTRSSYTLIFSSPLTARSEAAFTWAPSFSIWDCNSFLSFSAANCLSLALLLDDNSMSTNLAWVDFNSACKRAICSFAAFNLACVSSNDFWIASLFVLNCENSLANSFNSSS